MRWPENWAPPYVIAWRFLWIGPLYLARLLFCILIGITYGYKQFTRTWEDTR